MKKYLLTLFFGACLLFLTAASHAETLKIITLKDGSVLKGKVVQLQSSVYTIETSNLGQIHIPESDILSITAPEALLSQDQQSDSNSVLQQNQLKSQVSQVQNSIMTNPDLMMEVQKIITDKEIQSLLSDPNLMNDILSYDQERIQENKNVQDLMKNEKIHNLMNKVYQKMPAQE